MKSTRTMILSGLMIASAAVSSISFTATAQDLPDGMALLDQCIEAMGGEEAFAAIKSSRVLAVAEVPGMGELTLNLVAAGDKFSAIQSIDTMGEVSRSGSDGEVVWGMDPMSGGFMLMAGEEAEQIRSQTHIATVIVKIKDEIKSAETLEKTEFNGAACYKVKAIDKDDEETLVFFDISTKLLAGIEQEQDNPMMGPVKVVMNFVDYKDVDPITVYTRVVIDQGGMEIELVFKEIEFNKVDDSVFALPEEVKELIAEQKASASDDGDDADDADDDGDDADDADDDDDDNV